MMMVMDGSRTDEWMVRTAEASKQQKKFVFSQWRTWPRARYNQFFFSYSIPFVCCTDKEHHYGFKPQQTWNRAWKRVRFIDNNNNNRIDLSIHHHSCIEQANMIKWIHQPIKIGPMYLTMLKSNRIEMMMMAMMWWPSSHQRRFKSCQNRKPFACPSMCKRMCRSYQNRHSIIENLKIQSTCHWEYIFYTWFHFVNKPSTSESKERD